MKKQDGFTIIELIAVILLLIGAGTLFLFQKQAVETYHRDNNRKTSVNAIHHHLEQIYFPNEKTYPSQISEDTVPGLAAELLVDPSGALINEPGSTLRYAPTDCEDGQCQAYTLRADLENEADFTKTSQE